jgi:hypothetical protein
LQVFKTSEVVYEVCVVVCDNARKSARLTFPTEHEELSFVVADSCVLEGGRSAAVSVGLSKVRLFSFPKTLNSAEPLFSISSVHNVIRAGVAASSAISAISP